MNQCCCCKENADVRLEIGPFTHYLCRECHMLYQVDLSRMRLELLKPVAVGTKLL